MENPSSIQSSDRNLEKLELVLIGSHYASKNTVGNLIFGGRYFNYLTSWSKTSVQKDCKVNDCMINIVRTPGWYNLKESEKKTKDQIKKSLLPNETDAFLLVISLKSTPFTKSDQETLESLLTASVWNHTVVVFTYGETLTERGLTIEQQIKFDFNDLIQKCGGRYIVLYSGWGPAFYQQGEKITDAVKSMKQRNNDQMYQMENGESVIPSHEDDDTTCQLQSERDLGKSKDTCKAPKAASQKQKKTRVTDFFKKKASASETGALQVEMNRPSEPQEPVSTTDGMNTPEPCQIDRRKWMETLSDIMQNLSEDNFKKLKYYCKSIDGTIPPAEIENKERHDMPGLLESYFGVNGSVLKTRDVMKYIPCLHLQDKLMPYLTTLGEPW